LLALAGHLLAEALLHAPVQAPRPLASCEPPFVDAVEAWLQTRGIDYNAAARGRRETTLVLGDDLRLRLLPTPRRSEDCLDPGSSARLTDAAEAQGSSIIHLHEDTWRLRGNIVRDRLLNRVQATQRVFARKTTARPIAAEEAIAFLDEHHLWGPTNAKYAYGLYLGADLVAVATFTKRKLVKRSSGKRRTHELLRFCARRDMRVVGGITKLLSAFRKDRDVDDIVTNIDRDWGGGAGWRAIGFETVEIMPPLPMAIDANEGRRRFLCGRSVGIHRPGLPDDLVAELAVTADGATERLAARGLQLIHDSGVERLLLKVSESRESCEDLWATQRPRKNGFYGPTELPGIAALLEDARRFAPGDDESHDVAAWFRAAGAHSDARILASRPSCFNNATVELRERKGGWRTLGLRCDDGRNIYHGIYNADDPTLLLAEHLRTAAALFVAALPIDRPLRFLHLGHGAGVLQRYLQAVLPGSDHVSVDLDGAVLDVSAFEAPHAGRAVQGDALDYVCSTQETYDAIFVDIFDEQNVCPAAFSGAIFLEAAASRLADDGVLIHNLHIGGKKRDAAVARAEDALARHFHAAYRAGSVDSTPTGGNALLLGAKRSLGRAQLHENATRAGLGFDAGTRVRRLVRLCCDDDVCK
jgi:spermidine synthase